MSDEPKKPELHYIVNEKINAIAPNITKKSVESIRDSIEANFISSMYGEFFKQTNLTAEKIQSYQKNISRAREMINRLADSLPRIHEKLEKWQNGLARIQEILPKIEEILLILSDDLSKIQTATEKEIPIDDIGSEMKNFVKAQTH